MKTTLMKILNDILTSINKPKSAEELPPGTIAEHEPTQKDKPSPHSSLTLKDIERRHKKAYPVREGFRHSFVSNTNSMEPMLDDNCHVVSEWLTSKWKHRVENTPLTKGDIVIYQTTNGGNIIHTLIKPTTFLGKKAWIIQGHNNFLPDMAKITEDGIVARYVDHGVAQPKRPGD